MMLINTQPVMNHLYNPMPEKRGGWKRRNFNIYQSRIPDRKEIKESMLAYSQKMDHMKSERLFYPSNPNRSIEVPLLVKATHIDNPVNSLSSYYINRYKSKKANMQSTSKSHTVPNMRLEPLLGKKDKNKLLRSLDDINLLRNTLQLQSINKPALAPILNTEHNSNTEITEQTTTMSTEIVPGEIPEPNGPPEQPDKVNTHENSIDEDNSKEQTTPIKSNQLPLLNSSMSVQIDNDMRADILKNTRRIKIRCKKNRRMKLHKPDLGVIEEREEQLRLSRHNTLFSLTNQSAHRRESNNQSILNELLETNQSVTSMINALPDIPVEPEVMKDNMEQRKYEVALQRQIQQSIANVTSRDLSQTSLQNHAKRKFKLAY